MLPLGCWLPPQPCHVVKQVLLLDFVNVGLGARLHEAIHGDTVGIDGLVVFALCYEIPCGSQTSAEAIRGSGLMKRPIEEP